VQGFSLGEGRVRVVEYTSISLALTEMNSAQAFPRGNS